MLTTIASFLITRGVPMRWAKPLIYVVLAVLLIAAALLAKHLYDNHVIEQHEAERAAIVERSARQASEGATAKRSEEHTSELQSLMRISYAVFCLKKKNKQQEKK